MSTIKRRHSAAFKAKVALEMIQGRESVSQIVSKYGIHPTQANQWKQQALAGMEASFNGKGTQALQQKDAFIDELHKQIGKLTVELSWVKKTAAAAEAYSA